jgi:hypothetical protein
MVRVAVASAAGTRAARLMLIVIIGAGAAFGIGFAVWFAGYDILWSVAAALAVGSVGGAIASLTFDGVGPWDPQLRPTPRATQLTVATIEQSLAACDRLARPSAMRWMYVLLNPERNDQLARSAIVRQMRTLIVAEMHDRGIDPITSPDDVLALLGPDALAVLEPSTDTPVTSAAISRCLDAMDRLASTNPGSR